MIEQKLQQAANALPENSGDFVAVENRVSKKSHSPRPARRRRLAIAMVLTVLLVGCMSVTVPDYHLYNGNWWQFIPGLYEDPAKTFGLHWEQTQKAADELGITLPETLGDNPVIGYDRFNLTTRKVPIQIAWLSPRYVYHSSYYGIEMEEAYTTPDGVEGTGHWREGADVTYGSTDDEVWRRQFGYDENDVYTASDSTSLVEITGLELEGITVYVGQFDFFTFQKPYWRVTWVDYNHHAVFSIAGEAETPEALITYAREIIALNK